MEWRGKKQARRWMPDGMAKEIRGNGIFFLPFSFPFCPPLFFLRGGVAYQERGEFFVHSKKASDEKESTCTKTLDIPPRSRAQFVVCVSPCVRHNSITRSQYIWTNQTVANISKSPFFPSTPAKIKKKLYIQALDFSHSQLFNCHVFCLPLDSFSSSRYPSQRGNVKKNVPADGFDRFAENDNNRKKPRKTLHL